MTKVFVVLLAAFLIIGAPRPAEGALKSELSANLRGNLDWILDPANTLQATVSASYYRSVHRNILLGGTTNFQIQSGTLNRVTWYTLLGPTFSFGGKDLRDDFFIRAGLGLSLAAVGATQTSFLVGASVGKRFRILDSVSYAPSLQILIPTQDNVSFQLQALALSILL